MIYYDNDSHYHYIILSNDKKIKMGRENESEKVLLAGVSAVLALSLAACGNNEKDNAASKMQIIPL